MELAEEELRLEILKGKIRKLIESSRKGKRYWKQAWVSDGRKESKSINGTKNFKPPKSKAWEGANQSKLVFQNPEFSNSMETWGKQSPERKAQIQESSRKAGLSHLETLVVFHYTTREGNYRLNKRLREHKLEELSQSERAIVETLDKAIKKLPKAPGVVFRKITVPKEKKKAFLKRYCDGKVISENQFVSTSKDEDHAKNRIGNVLMIYIQKSGREITKISNFTEEAEVLMPRKLNYEIKAVYKTHLGITIRLKET